MLQAMSQHAAENSALLKALRNGGNNTTTTDGTGGILQPAADPHASLFAPLHLSRLGAN